MTLRTIPRPGSDEYAPYAQKYIGLLPEDDRVLEHLRDNLKVAEELVRPLDEGLLTYSFAPGEWTIKEILVHISDAERVFVYRALRFARNDTAEQPRFDPEEFALRSKANARRLDSILAEYASVRMATLSLFDSLDNEALARAGVANGNRITVRAIAYFAAGHERHHLNSIRENYL